MAIFITNQSVHRAGYLWSIVLSWCISEGVGVMSSRMAYPREVSSHSYRHGRYASYWKAFLFDLVSSSKVHDEPYAWLITHSISVIKITTHKYDVVHSYY